MEPHPDTPCQRDRYSPAGSHGLAYVQGWVAKAPTRGARWQERTPLILEVIALTRAEAFKLGVAMQVPLADHLPSIRGDRGQLQQVIINLVINAIQAMRGVDGPHELGISTEFNRSNEVHIAVRDSGPGVSVENLPHLFEPFYTTKPEGMGMGLSICRSIIEDHGGRLWVKENNQEVHCFNLRSPSADVLPIPWREERDGIDWGVNP
jgi:signal transduction histidine kinase